MDRENSAQSFERALILELAGSMIGVVLPIRLGDAHVEFASTNRVDVVDRATRAFDSAANTVGLAVFVHESAN